MRVHDLFDRVERFIIAALSTHFLDDLPAHFPKLVQIVVLFVSLDRSVTAVTIKHPLDRRFQTMPVVEEDRVEQIETADVVVLTALNKH